MFDTRAMATGQARNLAVDSFELDERADAATRRADLRLVGDRVTPMALAREQTLPVIGPLMSLLPVRRTYVRSEISSTPAFCSTSRNVVPPSSRSSVSNCSRHCYVLPY